jgi:hypothetical protein
LDKGSHFYSVMQTLVYSPYKNFVIGLFAGGLEVAVDQPLVTLKNILQKRVRTVQAANHSSQPSLWKSLSLRQLYAGAGANAIGMSMITGMQMWAFGCAQKMLAGKKEVKDLTPFQNLFAACFGGTAAAPFASWSEMVMDKYRENVKSYEEKGKKGIKPTYAVATKELWKQYSWRLAYLGMVPTVCREIGFTAAYTAIGPYFGIRLKENTFFHNVASRQQLFPVDLVAAIVGGVFAGMFGAAVTHPFDTWKTRRQGGMKVDFWPQGVNTIFHTSMQIGYQTGKWNQAMVQLFHALLSEPYKGFGPRFTRMVSAVTLLSLVNWAFNEHLKQYNKK